MRLHHSPQVPLPCRRPGFSLVEMMIVIMIIGILVTLTAAGAFQVMLGRRVSNTELLLRKAEDALLKQWRKVIDQAGKEPIPDAYLNPYVDPNGNRSMGLLTMAGGDVRRARVLWIKLRLKQEFPMTFQEALAPNGPNVKGPDPSSGQVINYLPQQIGATPVGNLTYRKAILSAAPLSPPYPNPVSAPSSALLLLAVSQGRTGADFNPEDLGASFLSEGQFTRNSATDVISLKYIVDSWNNPIVFWRWPVGNPEIQAGNPAVGASQSEKFRDPVDPEGLLLQSSWNNPSTFAGNGPVWAFEQLFHPVHLGNYQPKAFYSTPVVASAGRDGKMGMTPVGSPLQPDLMMPDGSGSDSDNIYSNRLRLGARGD